MSAPAQHVDDWVPSDIADMLDCIPADAPRADWVRIGMALKSHMPGPDGFALFEAWSKSAPDKFEAKDCRAAWDGIQQGGSVGFGTLVHTASRNGYRRNRGRAPLSPEERARLEQERAETMHRAAQAKADNEARRALAVRLRGATGWRRFWRVSGVVTWRPTSICRHCWKAPTTAILAGAFLPLSMRCRRVAGKTLIATSTSSSRW